MINNRSSSHNCSSGDRITDRKLETGYYGSAHGKDSGCGSNGSPHSQRTF